MSVISKEIKKWNGSIRTNFFILLFTRYLCSIWAFEEFNRNSRSKAELDTKFGQKSGKNNQRTPLSIFQTLSTHNLLNTKCQSFLIAYCRQSHVKRLFFFNFQYFPSKILYWNSLGYFLSNGTFVAFLLNVGPFCFVLV